MQAIVTVTPISLEEALRRYEAEAMPARNFAERTRREYRDDLADLIEFLTGKCGVERPDQVGREHLEGYLAELDRRHFAGSTRRRKVASIRSFFAYLQDAGDVVVSPAHKLIPPERERPQPRVLTEAEYQRLQLACRHEPRDSAIVELLLQTGMRLSELGRLTLADIELPVKITRDEGSVGSVRILGKGRKARTVTLNWKACRAIKAYLAVRPKVEGEPRLFLTKFKRGIGPRAIEDVAGKYLEEARIAGASVHSPRHAFATHSVKKGTKLDVVRQALGHAFLKTTSIYVELAREVMDKELQQNALSVVKPRRGSTDAVLDEVPGSRREAAAAHLAAIP